MQGGKPARKLSQAELLEYAVRRLGAKGYSTADLKSRLRLHGAPQDIDVVIQRLKELGYLNDRLFAETYASARVANNGFGRLRLRGDLMARRVAQNIAESAIDLALDGKSEQELINSWIDRRMPFVTAGEHIGDERKLARAYRRLKRAGFTSGAILTALKRRTPNQEIPPEIDGIEDEDYES